jgi:hypothetical protein
LERDEGGHTVGRLLGSTQERFVRTAVAGWRVPAASLSKHGGACPEQMGERSHANCCSAARRVSPVPRRRPEWGPPVTSSLPASRPGLDAWAGGGSLD